MKHEIIKTDNYLLVVDESEIKFDDWYIDDSNLLRPSVTSDKDYWSIRKDYKKVIAHLPLNGSPILEGVDLLPPLEEDDAEKKARELTNHLTFPEERKEGIIIGYNKAKEKYKYTEDDLIDAINMAKNEPDMSGNDIFQSLSESKMPIGFECAMKSIPCPDNKPDCIVCHMGIMTTTAPEGHTQWVGTYIY